MSRQYEFIQVSEPKPGVGQVTLNRPKALNALSSPLINELNQALTAFSASDSVSAIVLTGSQRAFAAGADIKEMAPLTFAQAYTTSFIESWSELTTHVKKPIIAAVSGHALGGGCELALMCDILYCTDDASFGQPEIKLGTVPGAGGSQRLTRAVAVMACKEVVNKSQDLPLRDGIEYERRVFHSLFGSQDQKIGMKAFAEKKKAEWSNQ